MTSNSKDARREDSVWDAAEYWLGLEAREIRLHRCTDCSEFRLPTLPTCPNCGGSRFASERSSGRGSLYSFIRVHRAFSPRFAHDIPYVVGVVELEEGPRVLGRVELETGAKPEIGLELGVRYRARTLPESEEADDEASSVEAYFVGLPEPLG